MKALFLAVVMFVGAPALADNKRPFCSADSTRKIDTHDIYAELVSVDHMQMKFALIVKRAYSHRNQRFFKKVIGGPDFHSGNLPSCDESQNKEEINARAKIDLYERSAAVDFVAGQSSKFYGAYRLCFTDFTGKLIAPVDLCGWETGD